MHKAPFFTLLPNQKGDIMNYGNSNPFQYDYYLEGSVREAKKSFSRFHLALFIYVVVSYFVSITFDIVLLLAVGEQRYLSIVQTDLYRWGIGIIQIYLISLPILYLIVRKMPKIRMKASKMKTHEFFILFAISQALMMAGNIIGSTVNSVLGAMRGEEITDTVADLITTSSVWYTLIIGVIIGPIVEEFIFRKLMIDRLAKFGTVPVIIVSGVSFGLFHGNLHQFFYATFLGTLFAYVTIRYGSWLYSALLHVLANLLGSIGASFYNSLYDKINEALASASAGADVNSGSVILMQLVFNAYTLFEYALIFSGIVLLILAINRKWYVFERNTATVYIPKERMFSCAFSNPGSIMFFSVSMLLFAVSALFV